MSNLNDNEAQKLLDYPFGDVMRYLIRLYMDTGVGFLTLSAPTPDGKLYRVAVTVTEEALPDGEVSH